MTDTLIGKLEALKTEDTPLNFDPLVKWRPVHNAAIASCIIIAREHQTSEISDDEVERVARAIVRSIGLGEDDCVVHDNTGPFIGSKPRWQWYIPEAIAAIAAMSPKRESAEDTSEREIVTFPDALKTAQAIVESYPLYRRFIDGTPLQNDIAVWMVEFALKGGKS